MHVTPHLRPATRDARELVVVVHGLSKRILDSVPGVVADERPHADVLTPTYEAGWLSNADPIDLADEISGLIDDQCEAHRRAAGQPYERLVLVGHSRGALLVRKAYVFARGENQELWRQGLQPAPRGWAALVDRIILLAGLNRGWSLWPKPPAMSWGKWLTLELLEKGAILTRQAQLLLGLRRGAPFVANLRVQWIRLTRSGGMPLTVQILGDMDDVVSRGDNIDLQAGQQFVYLDAPRGTTHAAVVDLAEPARRAVFVRALTEPAATLRSQYTVPDAQREDASIQQVVFIVHGIRDFGGWTQTLATRYREQALAAGRRAVTVTASYGYFPMFRFLIFSERQRNVRWFMDRYTEVLARYPNAASIDFVGHSNGTYLLGSALRRYRSCRFGRAICAGSVLPRDFEWDEMAAERRLGAVRNYVASRDWVVGVFPNFFDRFGDIGGGGFLGFVREPAAGTEFHYVTGGHSAAVADANLASMAAFLLDGRLEAPPETMRSPARSGLVLLASKLHWVVWLALGASVVGGAWFVAFAWAPAVLPYAWLRVALFIAILVALLNSV